MEKEKIKEALINAAREKTCLTYYSILNYISCSCTSKSLPLLLKALLEIGEDCYIKKEPPINVLASLTGKLPSPQFYNWYCDIYLQIPIQNNNNWKKKIKYYEIEKNACFDFWKV